MTTSTFKTGRFNVVYVPAEDTPEGKKFGPTVKFYDGRADRSVPQWADHGQFVSSYYLSTLLEHGEGGLCLDGGNRDVWTLDADQMKAVTKWLKTFVNAPKTQKQHAAAIKKLHGRARPDTTHFPTERWVLHKFLIEAQSPNSVTTNEDGEISSAAVTKAYVEEYCRLNMLKVA
jgi:hypothetical protein